MLLRARLTQISVPITPLRDNHQYSAVRKLMHKCIKQTCSISPDAKRKRCRRKRCTDTRVRKAHVRQWMLPDWSMWWLACMHVHIRNKNTHVVLVPRIIVACNRTSLISMTSTQPTTMATPLMVTNITNLCFTCDRAAPSHTPQELLLQWCGARV